MSKKDVDAFFLAMERESSSLDSDFRKRICLRDRPGDGADHACVDRLGALPRKIPTGSALFGLMFYDGRDRTLCLHPYSVVTPKRVVRLQY